MQIVGLQVENFKRIKAVEIIPQGNTVIISGANGQGKTSILDAIWAALGGAKADKAQGTIEPIHGGEKKAGISVDLGDIKVTRKWTSNDKSTLVVENQQGAKFKSPQAMLDKLVGSLSFDPLAFSQMEDKNQLETLMGLVKFSIDPKELDRQKKELFDERTIVNRMVSQNKAKLDGLPVPDEDTPAEELVVSEILEQIQTASETLTANNIKRSELQKLGQQMNTHKAEIKSFSDQIDGLDEQIARLNKRIDDEQIKLSEVIEKGKALQAEVAKLKDPDIEGLQQQMTDIEKTNKAYRSATEYREVEQRLKTSQEESQAFTNKIQAIEQQKETMLKEAKFPIDGLGFNEQGVTFNGIPFKQCSNAERLKVSLAMAMALNPELKVIRITNGNLLDSSNMAVVEQMAKDNDYQIWLEMVDESGKMGIYIEDGEVVTMPTIAAVKIEPEQVKKAKTVDDVLASLDDGIDF